MSVRTSFCLVFLNVELRVKLFHFHLRIEFVESMLSISELQLCLELSCCEDVTVQL